MKKFAPIIFWSLLLAGCSPKHAPAIQLVEGGKVVRWDDGYVIFIGKRDGNALENISVSRGGTNGISSLITADTGMVAAGSIEDPSDNDAVSLTLQHVLMVTDIGAKNTVTTTNSLTVLFHRAR